jgi:hypothetical protein
MPLEDIQFTIASDQPAAGQPGSGPVRIGWLLTKEEGSLLFDMPERVRSVDVDRTHAKSASRCPAIINLESRYFVVKSPYDMHLRFTRDDKGKPVLRNMAGTASPIRQGKLNQVIKLVDEREWRYKDRPTLQMVLPHLFITDEPVFMSQVEPFMHYRKTRFPGLVFGGRFPIHIWPRPLMWAFEWVETDKDLEIRRGDALFYVCFETVPQDRAVQIVEAERTPELDDYLNQISAVVNYVNQTFSLFREAEKRRPERLLTMKKR